MITKVVEAKQSGARLSRYLAQIPVVGSRKRAEKWLKQQHILVNDQPALGSRMLKCGDKVEILPPKSTLSQWEFNLEVIFQNQQFAIINKPAGIHVSGNHQRTVRRALSYNLHPSTSADRLPQPEPLHRLDRRTSGLLVIAKTVSAQINIHRAFADRQVTKKYQAVVSGWAENGTSNAPIDGKDAHSRWTVLQRVQHRSREWITLVEVRITTGRTHQIRRHLSAAGHPILGDDLYNDSPALLRGKGLFLCATELSFPNPITSVQHHFQIPAPSKFNRYLIRQAQRALTCDTNK